MSPLSRNRTRANRICYTSQLVNRSVRVRMDVGDHRGAYWVAVPNDGLAEERMLQGNVRMTKSLGGLLEV